MATADCPSHGDCCTFISNGYHSICLMFKHNVHLCLNAADLCWRQVPAAHQAEGGRAAGLSNSLIQLGNLHQDNSSTG